MATSVRPCSDMSGLSRANMHCFNAVKAYAKRKASCDFAVMTSVELKLKTRQDN